MTLVEVIENTAMDLLFKEAVKGGDRFRQWFYPNLPNDYTVNNSAQAEITELILVGKSAKQIAEVIVRRHS